MLASLILFRKRLNICFIKSKNALKIKYIYNETIYSLIHCWSKKQVKKLSLYLKINYILSFLFLFKQYTEKLPPYYYYSHLKLYGLGFRISLVDYNRIRLDFGWSHVVFFALPDNVKIIKKKNDFLLFSKQQQNLNNFIFILTNSYIRSPYTLKGVFNIHKKINVKVGKQRQK